jgi:hypothetical protein
MNRPALSTRDDDQSRPTSSARGEFMTGKGKLRSMISKVGWSRLPDYDNGAYYDGTGDGEEDSTGYRKFIHITQR